jgi:hypothetical protein
MTDKRTLGLAGVISDRLTWNASDFTLQCRGTSGD